MKNLNIFLCTLIAPVLIALFGLFGGATTVFAQTPDKTYNYVVSMGVGGLDVFGEYANNETYPVAQGIGLENVAAVIDADRFSISGLQNANIHFQNVSVGDNYLHLSNGTVTLSGTLSGFGFSTYGLVYVDGATVKFDNINLSNNGLSYLVKNAGAGNLQFQSGTFSANSTLITSRGAGNVEISGGTFTSENASVVELLPTNAAALTIGQSQDVPIKLVAKGSQPVVIAKNAQVRVFGGAIQSTRGQNLLVLENTPLVLGGAPTFQTTAAHIKTDVQITASYFSNHYVGQKLLVDFTGDIVSWQTILVKQLQSPLFEIANTGYILQQSGTDYIICKFGTIKYQDPRGFIINMPVDDEKYLMGQNATILFIDEDDDVLPATINKYIFMGWSQDPNATTAQFTITNRTLDLQEQDITLYAVWQAREFVITYEKVDGAVNPNPTAYSTEDSITFVSPTKEFYVFKGWKVNGASYVRENFEIRAGTFGDLNLEAVWEFEEFDIVYHNLNSSDVQELNLQTSYTIDSVPLELELQDVLCKGYGFFGLYLDSQFTIPLPQTVYFTPDDWQNNTQEFLAINNIGQTINIFVDARPYSNGMGDGSAENPFLLDTANQFAALFTGEKIEIAQPIFIKFAQDLIIAESFENNFSGFENFVVDGANHTLSLSIQAFGNFDGTITFLPQVKNSTIKNLTFQIATQRHALSHSFAFSGIVAQAIDATFENVCVCGDVKLSLQNAQSASTLKFAALAINANGATFNNVSTQIDFDVMCNVGYDVNIYGANFVGFSADDCTFINSQNNGNINLNVQNQREAFVYVSAFASLGENSKVWNCLNRGDITAVAENAHGFLCGTMAFGADNAINNFVNIGDVSKGDAAGLFTVPFAYAGAGVVQQKNVFSATDFSPNAQAATLQKLGAGVANLIAQTNCALNVWFMDGQNLGFAKGVVVNFVGNGLMPNQTHHFENIADAGKKFIWYDTHKYHFQGWFLADGTPVDWEKLNSQQVTVFAKFVAFEDVVQQQQTIALGMAIGVFLIFLFILYLFDRKKPVRYYYKGEWIDTRRFGRTKIVTLPPEFDGKICFLDKDGEKPFIKKKMPCHKISLFVFEDEKQNRLEEFWNHFFELKKNKIEEKKSKKIKKQEERIKKQQEIEKQKEKERKKQRAKSNKKQTTVAKKSSKKKVLKNSKDNSKITITKQEIKMKKK